MRSALVSLGEICQNSYMRTHASPLQRESTQRAGLIDGELATLGLQRIPVIGLAKEFEEIHRPGEPEPLRLSHDTGALKLLQKYPTGKGSNWVEIVGFD